MCGSCKSGRSCFNPKVFIEGGIFLLQDVKGDKVWTLAREMWSGTACVHLRVFRRGGGRSLGGRAQVRQAGTQGFAAIEGAQRRSWRLHRRAIAAIACALSKPSLIAHNQGVGVHPSPVTTKGPNSAKPLN